MAEVFFFNKLWVIETILFLEENFNFYRKFYLIL